jgi:hypothetical protein
MVAMPKDSNLVSKVLACLWQRLSWLKEVYAEGLVGFVGLNGGKG